MATTKEKMHTAATDLVEIANRAASSDDETDLKKKVVDQIDKFLKLDSVSDADRKSHEDARKTLTKKVDDNEDRKDADGVDKATIERIDRAMGIDGGANRGITRTASAITLGTMSKAEAKAFLAQREAEGWKK